MIFHIIKMSTYAQQILQNSTNGVVHSVYEKTINILVDGHLLALQTLGSPFSPISLFTDMCADEFAHMSVNVGTSVYLDLSSAEIQNLAPRKPILHLLRHDLYRKFSQVIGSSATNGFNLIFQMSPKVDDDLILSSAEVKIHEAHSFHRRRLYKEAADKLCELIGLGIGLTPSGDDFLCGILAGLRIQGLEEDNFAMHLQEGICNNLQRTNEISQAFLSCALKGHFSLAVNNLWNKPSAEEIANDFLAIGHSSGMDTLCGIYFLFFLME